MSLFQYYRSFQQSKASTEPVLTFEDLSIDSDLTDLQRFLKYVKSSIGLQRLSQVKLISTIVEEIGFSETKTTILPLIETISKDSEPVIRQHLIVEFLSLTKVCINHNSDEGYKCFIDTILSCVIRLLLDESTEVRQAAKDCYLSLLPYIRKDQVGEMLLSSTLRLGHDDNNENARIIAIEILLSSVDYLDIDLIENFVLSEIVSLTDDPSLRIRKCLVQYLPRIFKYISIQKIYDILLPSLKTLCQDTMYRVRLACIPSIIDISFLVHETIRITHLFPIYQSLLHDSSNEVQITALKHIGKFIASLPTDSIDTSLLNKYYSLLYDDTTTTTAVNLDADTIIAAALLVTDNGETTTDIDNNKDDGKDKDDKDEKEDKERDDVDYVYSCAYAFPGVCKALGPTRWNELKKLYQDLCHSKHGKVKETLASSLHEVAAILKEETVVEDELVPIFDDFLQESEQIQELLLHHLSSFLQYLSYPCRISYMTLIHNILHSSNPFNWRLRYCIARQLPTMIHLTEKNTVTDILFPLMMTLLQDPVAVVRQQSYIGITTLLSFLCHDISSINDTATSTVTTITTTEENSAIITDQVNNIVTSINAFITHNSYQFRQLWIDLCHYLLKYLPQHIIESYFIEGIVVLSHDPVSNVRISLAKLLTGWCKNTTATKIATTEKDSEISLLSDIPDITAIYLKENSNWTWLLYTDDIKEVVMTLSCDEKDVYDYMVLLESVYPEITFSMVNHKNGTKDVSTRHHKDRSLIGEKEEDTNVYNEEEEEQRRKEKEQLRLSNGELYIRKSIDGSMLSQIAHLTPPSSPSHGTLSLSSPGHSLDLSSSSSADMPNIDGLPEDMYQLDVHHQLSPTHPPL